MLAVPPLRRRALRRMTMIDLHYPESPILDERDPAAGIRLPNPALQTPEGGQVRLYDVLPLGPALLDLSDGGAIERMPGVEQVIRIGAGGLHDESRILQRLLPGARGWILVRPDTHIAWARAGDDGMEQAIVRALGY
jgi:hypothetical protein